MLTWLLVGCHRALFINGGFSGYLKLIENIKMAFKPYSSSVLIGNWYEDVQLEEVKLWVATFILHIYIQKVD